MIRVILPLAALGLLAACATLNEDQCRAGNWRDIGLRDGYEGRSASFISNHAKACSDYGIAPDAALYEEGRRAGIALYCTPTRAYDEGTEGHVLKDGVCPPDPRLTAANRRGLALYRLLSEIRSLEREISAIDARIASLEPGDPERAALMSERAAIRLEILTLRAERGLYR